MEGRDEEEEEEEEEEDDDDDDEEDDDDEHVRCQLGHLGAWDGKLPADARR